MGQSGESLTCKSCGGPITLRRSGQTAVLPATTLTLDGEHVIEERTTDDAWCGDCVDEWNRALTDREAS